MKDAPLALDSPSVGWGHYVLGPVFLAALAILLLIIWAAPEFVIWTPALILAACFAAALLRFPLLYLCLTLAGFVVIARYEEGIQPEEVVYGLIYSSYLAYWYFSRIFIYQEKIIRGIEDTALAIFAGFAAFSTILTLIFGGSFTSLIGEMTALSMLAFYFPIKEACRRDPRAVKALFWVVVWFGVFVAVRNLINYQELLLGATQVWQVARGRVHTNEILLMMPGLAVLAMMIHSRDWYKRIGMAALFVLFFGSLILTQSRGYWASFLFGVLLLFFFVDARGRLSLGLTIFVGLLSTGLIAFLFFEDFVGLIGVGLVDRLASLGTAHAEDISLVNRFVENEAVWDAIKQNPVLGYGTGVAFSFYDIIHRGTLTVSFIHNGYLALWFKFGIVGLLSMLVFWGGAAYRGIRVYREASAPHFFRVGGLIAGVALFSEMLVANTSNPFYIADAMVMFAILSGIAVGSWEHLITHRTIPPDGPRSHKVLDE